MSSLQLALLCIVLAPLAQCQVDINVAMMGQIYSNLDRSSSPCANLWAHSCGNWSGNYMDNFERAEASYAKAMALVLSGTHDKEGENATHLLQQIRDYFASCVISDQELQLPHELISGHLEWTNAAGRLRKYGVNGVFLDESVDVAYNDSRRYVIQLKMPAQNDHLPMATLSPELQQLDRELRELCRKYRREEPTLQSWTLGELKQQIPQIDWKNYFEALLEVEPKDDQLRVEVSDVGYLRELGTLLQNRSTTSLQLYLTIRLTSFARKANPNTGLWSRVHSCIQHMRAVLPLGMNYIYDRYVYRTRSEDTRQLMEIFTSLRRTFNKYLDYNHMELSPQELDYVRAKLAGVHLKLGNLPDATTSGDFYDSHYASANFSRSDFQHNFWQALRLRTRLQHAPLLQHGAVLQPELYYLNDDVLSARNAPYFEHERNTLTVPLIFMQWPFYDYRLHSVFQYSLMGFILGHELMHGFEQDGILFDATGNESELGLQLRQQPRFQAALKCVQKTPTASLKERLADVNGLQLAYDAFFGIGHDSQRFEYRPYDFERELLAPQLFHLNFAQFFCGRLPLAIDHDMDDVRVNVAESNLKQFSTDFNCQQQAPFTGCEMWRPST
ncbi:neprilysin-1 [Drosophila grimshawi]|uniref:GH21315 n=1 Tax=Drosophila grimshawi TaxID=7222 RepID=B4J885_DROGR|nr:neprilysin-1 [Drosophila grimshawi]EDW01222.1 GH21315 [Drosophila grimshawi]